MHGLVSARTDKRWSEAVFATEKIDQGYKLKQAIAAFARPEDRAEEEGHRKDLEQEQVRLKAQIARLEGSDPASKRVQWYDPRTCKHVLLGYESLESSQEGIAAWRSANLDTDYAGWFETRPAFTTSESRYAANQARIQLNAIMLRLLPRGYSTLDPITRGGAASGRRHRLRQIGRVGILRAFLSNLACNEHEAWQAVEKHFKACHSPHAELGKCYRQALPGHEQCGDSAGNRRI
jgi:hypothetical protein